MPSFERVADRDSRDVSVVPKAKRVSNPPEMLGEPRKASWSSVGVTFTASAGTEAFVAGAGAGDGVEAGGTVGAEADAGVDPAFVMLKKITDVIASAGVEPVFL